jgi:hypothetical protein
MAKFLRRAELDVNIDAANGVDQPKRIEAIRALGNHLFIDGFEIKRLEIFVDSQDRTSQLILESAAFRLDHLRIRNVKKIVVLENCSPTFL